MLNAALQVKGVADTPELREREDQVAALRDLLRIRSQNRSDYYLVEFTSTSRQHAALVALLAIMVAFPPLATYLPSFMK